MNRISIFYFWVFLFLSFSSNLNGQTDSIQIQEIKVVSSKIRNSVIGSQVKTWNENDISQSSNNTIADFLSNQSGTFIKNYGSGSLATSSLRGGSAGHTLVLWNGLPIQSPMLGLLDLSLLPTAGIEEVTLQTGGNSALWGSGAIGGIISLNNLPNFSNQIGVHSKTSFGSFGELNQSLNLKLGNKKFQSVSKLLHQQADNDFFYEIDPQLQKRQQTNAMFSQQNILQDLYWKPNNKYQFAFHFWQQFSERQIPPLTTQTESVAEQDDISTRFILEGKRIFSNIFVVGKIGFFDEDNNFLDKKFNLDAKNNFQNWFGEIEAQWNIVTNHYFYFGATQTNTKANANGYNGFAKENKSSLFSSYKYKKNRFHFQTSIRQELLNGKLIPIVPMMGLNYDLSSNFLLQLKVSKNYRIPTLNDRFWIPGGNENLLPESGWSEELGISYKRKNKNSLWKLSITGFNRNINNWIMWVPRTGEPFWSANNIAKVWSRGIENKFSFFYKKKKMKMSCDIGYDYILSTNQINLETPKINKGEQLLYTPKHQAFSNVRFFWRDFQVSYHHQFTGNTIGVNEPLPHYHIANSRIQYSFNYKKCKSIVFINSNNLLNRNYKIIERRPMPGRNFQFGINLFFNQNSKKT